MSGWVPPQPPRWWLRGAESAFQGRRSAREALDTFLAAADSGQRQAVFVAGEAGAGKSRLAAEAVRSLVDDGSAAVLLGHCLPDYPVAYEPFREAIRVLIDAVDVVVTPPKRTEVRRLLTELIAGGAGDEQAGTGARPGTRRHFDAVVEALTSVCRERLLVLVLEDMHWATESTIALLSFLVRRVAEARLLVLATYRKDPPDRSETVTGAVADLMHLRGVHRLELTGLDVAEIDAVLRAEAPELAGQTGAALAARLRDQTGGNPFLIMELLRELDERGAGGTLPVPATVRDAFAGRLSRLERAHRWLVELAAVLGEQVSVPLLRECVPDGETVRRGIETAAGLGLVVTHADGQGLRFPHALARGAVLETIPPVRRAELHAVAARALESHPAHTLPEARRLAFHYANAHMLGESREKTRYYLERAAALAERSLAYDEAADSYTQVANLTEDVRERDRVLLDAVDCRASAGRYTAAMDASERIARHSSDARTRLEAAVKFESGAVIRGVEGRAIELLGDALLGSSIDLADPVVVQAVAGLSRALARQGAFADAVRLGEPTLAVARRLGDDALLAQVLHRVSDGAEDEPGPVSTTLARGRELAELARSLPDWVLFGWACRTGCQGAFALGDLPGVRDAVGGLHLASDRSGHPWFDWFAWNAEVGLRFLRGDFTGAQRHAHESYKISREWPEAETDHILGMQMLLILRETDSLSPIASRLTGQEPVAEHWTPGLLALYTELGMSGPARQLLARMAAGEVLAANRGTPMWPAALAHLTEAASMVADLEALRRLRPYLAEYSGLYLVPRPFVGFYPSAARYLAMVDAALGQGDPLSLLDAAEDLDRRSGSVVHLAGTLATRAQYLASREGPRSRRVAEAVAGARAIAAPIGQRRVLTMLDQLAARTAPPSSASGPARAAGLTDREIEILPLLVEGASNKEIARSLFISENTAAKHVRAILTKSGATSRTGAAHHALTHAWVELG